MADTITTITIIERGQDPATVAARLLNADAATGLSQASAELAAVALGTRNGKVLCLVESSTPNAASGTVAVASGTSVAGDKLQVQLPGGEVVQFAAVALDATVTAASESSGYWSLETVTDTAQAQSLRDAINRHPGTRHRLLASESSGTVTLTAIGPALGSFGNSVALSKLVTTAGTLTIVAMSGGEDAGTAPAETCTLGGAALTANDTLTIGSVVLTWKASASTESEVTIGVDDATSLANLTAKINAHSKLQGLVLATDDAATICTITWLGPPRAGELLYFAKSAANASAMVITGSGTFASGPTEAYQADRKVWTMGAA